MDLVLNSVVKSAMRKRLIEILRMYFRDYQVECRRNQRLLNQGTCHAFLVGLCWVEMRSDAGEESDYEAMGNLPPGLSDATIEILESDDDERI